MSELVLWPPYAPPARRFKSIRGKSTRYRPSDLAVAAVLLYLPCAHYPAFRQFRAILDVPAFGSGNEASWSISPFFVPETILVLILAMRLAVRRFRGTSRRGAGLRPLVWAGVLTVVGGTLSLWASPLVGISLAGLAARCTVFALAVIVGLSAPSPGAVKLWAYAAISGTAVMCGVGLFYFVNTFGIPTTLESLPVFRVSPDIVEYQRATYGFASNTVDLLVLTTPTTLALLIAKGTGRLGRALLAASAVLMLANMLISFERWGWVSLGIAAAITLFYYQRLWRGLVVGGVVVSALVLIGSATRVPLADYFAQAADPASGSSLLDRAHAWGDGVRVLVANPAGVGLGVAGSVRELGDTSSHNLFLDIGVEGGILALIGSLVWAGRHCGAAFTLMRRRHAGDEWAFALLLGPLTFILYGVFFNSLLYFSGLMVWLAFWWCFPMMAYAIRGRGLDSGQLRELATDSTPIAPRIQEAEVAIGVAPDPSSTRVGEPTLRPH